MRRHEVEFKSHRLGLSKHIVKAKSRDAACERVERAYPKDELEFLSVNRLPELKEG